MLTTVRDSLEVEAAQLADTGTDDPAFSLFGLSLKQLALLLLIVALAVFAIIKVVIWIKNRVHSWYAAYKRSEACYFKRFILHARKKDSNKAQLSLYRWLDQLQLAEPTIGYFISHYGSEDMRQKYHDFITARQAENRAKVNYNVAEWQSARKNYILCVNRATGPTKRFCLTHVTELGHITNDSHLGSIKYVI